MADWNTPSLTTSYTGFLNALKDRDLDIATLFNNGTPTNIPVGAIKLDAGNQASTFRRWSGTAWVDPFTTFYAPNIGTFGILTTGGVITTGFGVSTGDCQFEIGGGRSGVGPSYIDFHSTASTDFEARIIRYGGANATLDLVNLGTGGIVVSQEGSAPLVFKTSGIERMRIDSAGRLGLGTSNPDRSVVINSSDAWLKYFNGNRSYLIGMGVQSNFRIWDETGAAERFTLLPNGNIGINAPSPIERFHVGGNIRAEGNLLAAGSLQVSLNGATGGGIMLGDDGDIVDLNDSYCSMRFTSGVRVFSANKGGTPVIALANTGDITATGNVNAYSDSRLKTNLERIDGALDRIEQLTGYTYDRVDREGRETGLLAQDVQRVLPEAVNDNGEYLSLAYGNLAGLLVEAIKELRDEVKGLKHA